MSIIKFYFIFLNLTDRDKLFGLMNGRG